MRFGRGFIILLSLLLAGLILLAWHEEPKQGTTLSLEISSGSSKEKITCWQSDSGESYFFLPSYGELDEARFRVSGKGTLALDGTVLTDGMSCGGLAFCPRLRERRFYQSVHTPSLLSALWAAYTS